jgi:RimJ/RimL family protein N-acetyltransferase
MFKGKKVQLRSLELEDAEIINQLYNHLEARRFLDDPSPLSREDIKKWIRNTWEDRKVQRSFFFVIESLKPKQLLGVCALFGLNPINQKAELMIAIYNKHNWGKGYGSDALRLLLNFGFNQLNLHRILLFTHDINIRAQRVYEKNGFKPSGRRRQASFFEGAYHDLLLYDMLAVEFRASHASARENK